MRQSENLSNIDARIQAQFIHGKQVTELMWIKSIIFALFNNRVIPCPLAQNPELFQIHVMDWACHSVFYTEPSNSCM